MKARNPLFILAVIILSSIQLAQAQQPKKVPLIGYVSSANPGPTVDAFRQGLRDLGYIEGENILVEYRHASRKRMADLVAEIVQLEVDVLVATTLRATLAAKQATKSVPIVMRAIFDPVASGIVDSLARPGGNITGLTTLTRELSAKRLELLKEAVPEIALVGVLWDTGAPEPVIGFKRYEAAARALKIPLQSLEVRGPNPDLEGAFKTAAEARVNGLIVMQPALRRYRKRITDLAIKNRLPSMFEASTWVGAGGLMSYAANEAEGYRRAAYYVDRILKGANSAELPIEQPRKFELVINLKTAKQLGLTIPPAVLFRADKIIK